MIEKDNIKNFELVKWFLKEEWRVYSSMFGSKRFLTFPLVIFTFALILGMTAPLFDLDLRILYIIYSALIILFGIQTGTIGFDARDTIENLLGETSRMLYASRTLPISQKRLVSIFLVKDAIFYMLVFLLPICVGVVAGIYTSPFGEAYFMSSLTLTNFVLLYICTVIFFIFGVSVGFVITTAQFSNSYGLLSVSILFLLSYLLIQSAGLTIRGLVIALPNYLLMTFVFTLSIILSIIGIWQFRASENINKEESYDNQIRKIDSKFSSINPSLRISIKSILDIHRSAGGFLKVLFGTSIVVISSWILVYILGYFVGLLPRYEYLYAGLFSLISYPLYTILFRYDTLESYSTLPVKEEEVYQSKLVNFVLIGFPLAIAYYTPVVIGETSFTLYLYGIALLISMMIFQLGLLMHFVEDKPIEFLFDGVLFSLYSVALFIVMVPMTVVGLYGQELTTNVTSIVGLSVFAVGIIGIILIMVYCIPNWGKKGERIFKS